MGKMIVSPSPHIHTGVSTQSLMRDVVIAMLPAVVCSVVFYGLAELVLLAVSVVSCVALEWLITKYLLKRPSTIGDLSAVVTGILLALNVPPTTPWWVIFIGAVVAIGVAKMTFGGIGQNTFNPAIVARVFLLISFPAYMTCWDMPSWGQVINTDAISGATLLGVLAEEGVSAVQGTDYLNTLLYNIGGSAGEVSVIALLLGFVYLLVRRVIRPWITLSIWGTVALFSLIFWLVDPASYMDPIFNLLTGGVLLGSIFMATDYVTSPMSDKGGVIFGVGIGLLTMLIRYFGSYPEGVSFAILLMNGFVPLINKFCHQKKYGRA